MTKTKVLAAGYSLCALALLAVSVFLYAHGWSLRAVSFGLGMSYILPAVTCLGLFIVAAACAVLEVAGLRRV